MCFLTFRKSFSFKLAHLKGDAPKSCLISYDISKVQRQFPRQMGGNRAWWEYILGGDIKKQCVRVKVRESVRGRSECKMRERVNTWARDKENKCEGETDINKDIQTETDRMWSRLLTLETQKNLPQVHYFLISVKSVMFYMLLLFYRQAL